MTRWQDPDHEGVREDEALEAMLAAALREDQRVACCEASLPAAGTVWWRATIRARADAARTATRPITAWQGVAAAASIGLIAGLGGGLWRSIPAIAGFNDVIDLLQTRRTDIAAASAAVAAHGLPVLLAVAACAIVAPIAIYLATDE
jgi:hypothetical protein